MDEDYDTEIQILRTRLFEADATKRQADVQVERDRAGRAAAWTKKKGTPGYRNPFSRLNVYPPEHPLHQKAKARESKASKTAERRAILAELLKELHT